MMRCRSITPTRLQRHGLGWTYPGETVEEEEMATCGPTAAGFATELDCPMAELEGLLAEAVAGTASRGRGTRC